MTVPEYRNNQGLHLIWELNIKITMILRFTFMFVYTKLSHPRCETKEAGRKEWMMCCFPDFRNLHKASANQDHSESL